MAPFVLFVHLFLPVSFFRKLYSWMERSCLLCCVASPPSPTAIWRGTRSTRSSTWRSGLCVPFPGRCPGPQCCVSGTCSSAMVTRVFPTFPPSQILKHPHGTCSPSARSQDHLPCGFGAVEVHAGISGEAEGLSGPVWNHGASPSHWAPVHAGRLPRSRGKTSSCRLHVRSQTSSFPRRQRLSCLSEKAAL